MVGIYDCFGYGKGYDISFAQRYRLIKNAGFDCVMLWWSDMFGRGDGYQDDVWLAKNAGLQIENIHAPVHEQNCLSLDNLQGDSVLRAYVQCVKDCHQYEIATVVIHLPGDSHPISDLGMKRLEEIICIAEDENIQIAFENLGNIQNLATVLDWFSSPNVGFCYDSCHHVNYSPDVDLLQLYGNRLKAIHLHDNGGMRNQHQLPFDGAIDWSDVMGRIAHTGYQGATTLEPMNWDYEHLTIHEFLDLAYQRSKKVDELRIT
ncbi:MAG: sugar phosphate isomerase/epimerase [Ruminococcaceae bacterium]|nr:sugar phosphate isomerase/epimerase [Oscillospiraceae bacterium]